MAAKKATEEKTKVQKNSLVAKEEKNEKEELIGNTKVESTLQKIFYCLVVIAVILLVGVIGIFAGVENMNGTSTKQDEEQVQEYDASMFKQVTPDEFVEAFKGSETQVIYIGRPTCSYCAAFLPTLQQAQKDYNYTTLYLNIDEVDSSEISKITELDEWLNTYYGTTPLVIVVKDGKIQGEGWVGYAEYDTFAAYLENLGFKKGE